ncbi:hypothetical protein HDV57DRAFT_201059 [Trichoderma longibrachiatum]
MKKRGRRSCAVLERQRKRARGRFDGCKTVRCYRTPCVASASAGGSKQQCSCTHARGSRARASMDCMRRSRRSSEDGGERKDGRDAAAAGDDAERCRQKDEERGGRGQKMQVNLEVDVSSKVNQWKPLEKKALVTSKRRRDRQLAPPVTTSSPSAFLGATTLEAPACLVEGTSTARCCMLPRYIRGACQPWWAKEIKARRRGAMIGRARR